MNFKRAKLLGIHLEGKQNFYINTIIKKASKECHTVARVYNQKLALL